MRFIRDLNPENKKILERISRQSKSPQVRDRAKCIILSYERFSIEELIDLFKVSRKTIYNWLTRWEDQKLIGLYNQKGRGRKPLFNPEQEIQIKDWVKAEPKNLKKIVAKIEKSWNIKASKETLKRILKKLAMRWKRMKRGTSKSPQDWELEVKLPRIEELKEQERRGEINLRYFDETGFTLTPYIPYGWQEKGQRTTLKSCPSKRINVLGIMGLKSEIYYQIYSAKIDSQIVINFFDEFSQNLSQKTVVFMDQASIHTSESLLKKLPEWQRKNLEIFWLPPYSPKLNLIEILWKFIKYEWMEVKAYESWKSLFEYIQKVLEQFGKEYVINFV